MHIIIFCYCYCFCFCFYFCFCYCFCYCFFFLLFFFVFCFLFFVFFVKLADSKDKAKKSGRFHVLLTDPCPATANLMVSDAHISHSHRLIIIIIIMYCVVFN